MKKSVPGSSASHSRRFVIIPDTQVRPGVPLDHLDWAAAACLEYTPDAIIVGGDWWDMPSLNSHSDAEELEGKRYQEDIDVGNAAFRRFYSPVLKGLRKRPRLLFCEGNHEDRINRTIGQSPKWEGHISIDDCDTGPFERYRFRKQVWLNGIIFSHYFTPANTDRPVGGEITNRLNKIGASFVSFHEQGLKYGNRICSSGKTLHGLVVGSYYPHIEEYRGPHQRHWRGIVVLNDVNDGEYDIMPLSMRFLCRRYEGMDLVTFFRKKYPKGNWSHLA